MQSRRPPQPVSVSFRPQPALRRAVRRGLLAGCALGAWQVGMAADAVAPADNTAPVDTGSMQEVVVTATRHEESLSKVPISATAITQEGMDLRGIKDIQDVARFTPGINVDNSGTSNISIRGISSSGGAGTTGIYIDDTPIQLRALGFNPDETLPKSFDIDRVEVLRGPQGTLFGSGSEGGTVRYITAQPSLSKTSIYSRDELSFTQGGQPSYELGVAAGGPIVDGTFGARVTVWYRRDGGWVDHVDTSNYADTLEKDANYGETTLIRLAGVWKFASDWTATAGIYYQDHYVNDVSSFWTFLSNPGSNHFVNADPTQRTLPDTFYLPSVKIEGDLGPVRFVSNTSYYHRAETTGYDGTLYNLGFYQAQGSAPVFPVSSFLSPSYFPLLDGTGVHLPASIANYRSPASVNNGQQNITQEFRLQSNSPGSALTWTTGLFLTSNRQSYLEQIHDPMLPALSLALTGQPYTNFFYYTDQNGNNIPVTYDPAFPQDSYFLQTHARDQQVAVYGEGTYAFLNGVKITAGARFANNQYKFNTLTGGPQLFNPTITGSGNKNENSFTPKLGISDQLDPTDMIYATYAKGFRPGGANNPVPAAACATDFQNFGITAAPTTYNSDTVNSFEVGMKNNLAGKVRLASSLYLIRWNNIQQTVVPPICQIQFISNLGQATAKGGDVQAEFSLSESWSADAAVGYTEARYTRDSRLTPAEVNPIVSNGDSIVGQSGQPNVPFTASLGLEYKFSLAQHDSLIRADYEYQGRSKWLPPGQDVNSLQYDAANFTLPATNFITLRASTTFGQWTTALFVDNLANSHTVTNYNWTIDPTYPSATQADTSRLLREFTFQPRTIGVTFTYRK